MDSASKTERAVFYTQLGSFDTHGTTDISPHMKKLDGALESFKKEMVAQGVWDDVVVVCASDFGRTLTSNGHGTDHGCTCRGPFNFTAMGVNSTSPAHLHVRPTGRTCR